MPKQSTSNRGRWPSLANSDQGTMEDWISLIKSWGTLCSGSPESYEIVVGYRSSKIPLRISTTASLKKRADFQRFFQIPIQEEWHEPFRMHPESFQDFR